MDYDIRLQRYKVSENKNLRQVLILLMTDNDLLYTNLACLFVSPFACIQ